jgi:hypothetical protein
MLWTRTAKTTALGAMALACGCSSHPTGVLGNGEFRYLCDGDPDTACSSGDSDIDLPGPIAVGSTFQMAYRPNSSTGSVEGETGYDIMAASPRLAMTSGNTIAALREGFVALMAQHVGNSTIDDFVHLQFRAIRTLVASPPSLTVGARGQESITLEAHDDLDAKLAGRLRCQWEVTSGGPSIALVGSPTGGSASITASGEGGVNAGTIHVVCGTASADVQVTVTGVSAADAGGPADASQALDGGSNG